MEMTREDARELLARPTYRRFLGAYSAILDLSSTSHEKLLQDFVSLVAEMEYELFHDWDQASILAHDTLQPICVDFFSVRGLEGQESWERKSPLSCTAPVYCRTPSVSGPPSSPSPWTMKR